MKNLQILFTVTISLFVSINVAFCQNRVAGFASLLPPSHAQVDYFLKIEGIDGEAKDGKHKKWIEILSIDWGAQQPGGGAASHNNRRRGDVILEDIVVVKEMDASSPKLQQACTNGLHIPEAIIKYRKANSNPNSYYIIKMNDVLISSYQTGGSSGDIVPVDQVSFNYSKIEVKYIKQNRSRVLYRGGK